MWSLVYVGDKSDEPTESNKNVETGLFRFHASLSNAFGGWFLLFFSFQQYFLHMFCLMLLVLPTCILLIQKFNFSAALSMQLEERTLIFFSQMIHPSVENTLHYLSSLQRMTWCVYLHLLLALPLLTFYVEKSFFQWILK